MSYIPPHKRHSKDPNSPILKPERLVSPSGKQNFGQRPFGYNNVERRKSQHSGPIIAKDAVSTWFSVGLHDLDDDGDEKFSSLVRLEPTSLKSYEQNRFEELPLILVLDESHLLQRKGDGGEDTTCPVKYIVTRVQKDLMDSFQNVRMLMDECAEVKPSLVARFGRIHFKGNSSITSSTSVTKDFLKRLGKIFYTNLPPSYMSFVEDEAVEKIGLQFDAEKYIYQVKIDDRLHSKTKILCKCRVMKNSNKLEIYKMELNPVRHFVSDISCLGQKKDVRLMLYTKRTQPTLIDEEKMKIENMISSAVLDPDVKGGLRWPLGEQSDGDRFSIAGVWHDKYNKSFRNSSMRLKVRQADRFDFENSNGECSGEVVLKMSQLSSCLRDNKFDENVVSELLKDYMKAIWDILITS